MDLDTPELQYIITHNMCNAFDWWPFLTDEQMAFLEANPHYGLSLFLPSDIRRLETFHYRTQVGRRIIPEMSFVRAELDKLEKLTPILGGNVWWDPLPEYNSADDCFHQMVAKKQWRFTSRQDAYEKITEYINSQDALRDYWSSNRKLPKLMAITGGVMSAPYMWEWGIELGLAEICVDSCQDIHPVIAIMRGAARQHGGKWGLDISHWRIYLGPTAYNEKLERVSGWSETYLERNLYIAYLSGANLVRIEEFASRGEPTATGEAGMNCGFVLSEDKQSVRLTPFGAMLERYADFALRQVADRGEPYVPVALMLDYYHGWKPRNAFRPKRSLWFGQLPYDDGDYMTDNVMDLIYPGHHRSGGVYGPPFASFDDDNSAFWDGSKREEHRAAYERLLAEGADTRPFEIISSAVFGNSFDCLLSNAEYETLKEYQALLLLGPLDVNPRLAGDIKRYVTAGGLLIANVKQLGRLGQDIFGVAVTDEVREDNTSSCRHCGRHFGEGSTDGEEVSYQYTVVQPRGARMLAQNDRGEALITENAYGEGKAVLITPHYAGGSGPQKTALLRVVRDYLEHVLDHLTLVEFPAARRELSYSINRKPGGYLLLMMNHTGDDWEGSYAVRLGDESRSAATQVLLGQPAVGSSCAGGKLLLTDRIPKYGFKIYDIAVQVE
jgi:hypothetical protein